MNAKLSQDGVLGLLGLDDSAIASISSLASSWVFETGEAWNCATPSAQSFAARLVQIVTDLNGFQSNAITFFTPLFKAHQQIKEVKKRVGFRDLTALQRDRVEAMLLSAPAYEFDSLSKERVMSMIDVKANPKDGVHFIIDRLLPDRAV